MTTYRIICVKTQHPHRHIVSVGVEGTPATIPVQMMTMATVRYRIDNGDTFETYSPSMRKTARVWKDTCKEPGCTFNVIRSDADAVADNNLDNLRACR